MASRKIALIDEAMIERAVASMPSIPRFALPNHRKSS